MRMAGLEKDEVGVKVLVLQQGRSQEIQSRQCLCFLLG